MSRHPHVLVFDSGVGGLSVAREIASAYPHCQLTYASDNAEFPYGSKNEDWLVDRVGKVIGALIELVRPDVVVIACNTASTLTLPHLRQCFDAPFVGVVPAIKPAAHISRSKAIGVLATPATVSRPYTHQLIADHAANCTVLLQGSSNLVMQAERKLMGLPPDSETIARELRHLISRPEAQVLDTIVLACTHFPLLKDELIEAALPRQFQWVDSGEAIARRVGYWLVQLASSYVGLDSKDGLGRESMGTHKVILTAPSQAWPQLQVRLSAYLGGSVPPSLALLQL